MSAKHPVLAITGSSGAGTTTVTTTFQQIFRREGVNAAIVYGDAFHRYDRDEMRARMEEAQAKGETNFSHFGPEANLFEELETLFRVYGEAGTGKVAQISARGGRGRATSAEGRHVHAVGGPARRDRHALLRGAARRRRHR